MATTKTVCASFVPATVAAAAAARRTSGGMVIAGPHCLIGMFFIATLLLRHPWGCQGCQKITKNPFRLVSIHSAKIEKKNGS